MDTGNNLTVIPVSVRSMSSLRTLDISENSIRELPKELANVRTLEVSILNQKSIFKMLEYICISSNGNVTTAKTSSCLYVYMWCGRAWSWMHRLWDIHLRQCARPAQRKCSATSVQVWICFKAILYTICFYYCLIRCRLIYTGCAQCRLCTRFG